MGFDPISMGLSAVGALAGGIGQHSANKKASAEQKRVQGIVDTDARKFEDYQQMLQGALGGNQAIFGPQTASSSGSSYGNSTTDSESAPTITPEFQNMVNLLKTQMEGRLQRGTSLPPGYGEMQQRQINQSYAPQETALRNLAARRGMSAEQMMIGSPIESAKANAQANAATQLPLMERQLQNEDMQQAQGLATAFGRGERNHSTTSSSQHSNQSSTQGPNASAMMAYYNMLAPRQTQIVQAPQQGSSLASALQGGMTGYQLSQMRNRQDADQPPMAMPNLDFFSQIPRR